MTDGPDNVITQRHFTNLWRLEGGAWRCFARHANAVSQVRVIQEQRGDGEVSVARPHFPVSCFPFLAPGFVMHIIEGDLDDPRVVALLETHLTRASAETARGSAHALDLSGLRAPDITFWSAWEDETAVAVGALRQLSADLGELKSMHTAESARGKGVGSALLVEILAVARARGLSRVSLETGSWPYFAPARSFYARHGFTECGPFGSYTEDSNSTFMTLALGLS